MRPGEIRPVDKGEFETFLTPKMTKECKELSQKNVKGVVIEFKVCPRCSPQGYSSVCLKIVK